MKIQSILFQTAIKQPEAGEETSMNKLFHLDYLTSSSRFFWVCLCFYHFTEDANDVTAK